MEAQRCHARIGVTPGSEICADSEYVILIPPLLDALVVLRTDDGAFVAERSLPKGRVHRQRADWGRLFLVSRTEPGAGTSPERLTFAMYDPVTNKDAWSLDLPVGSLWASVAGEDLAFLEPNGTLQLVDDQTGQRLWTASLPAQPVAPTKFTVHADESRLYVQTWHPPTPDQDQIPEFVMPPHSTAVPVNGLVVALDRRAGTPLWSRPMEQQLFRPHLPVGSGVLTYAAQRIRETPGKGARPYTKLEFLNRSTGEPVHTQQVDRTSGLNEGWARLPSGVLLLRVLSQDFRLTWEGESAPEATPPVQDEPVPGEAPIKAL